MKRDTIKTVIGLLIIGIIVVATFMYGNAQRQAQLRHDQDVKKQQEANASPAVSATPTPTPQVSAAKVSTPTPTPATAPVKSPSSNSIQGGSSGDKNGQVAGAASTTQPTAGGTGLPDTGAPIGGLVGVTAVVGMAVVLRRSRREVLAAARRSRL